MGAVANGFDFARGNCLPRRALDPGGEGNWRGGMLPRPFYLNTMAQGRATRAAPHRGAAVAVGGAPILLEGVACGSGLPGPQVGWGEG